MQILSKFKLIFLQIVLFLVPVSIFSQVKDSINKPIRANFEEIRITAGERIDIILTRGLLLRGTLPDSIPIDASRSGSYSLGLGLGIPVGRVLAFHFEPRLTWHNVFYRPEPQKTYPSDSNGIYHFEKERGFYVELPVGLKFNFVRNDRNKVRFFLEMGAQGGYLIGSTYKRRSILTNGTAYTEKFNFVEGLEKFRYGFYARVGTKLFAVHVFYRLSEVFSKPPAGKYYPDFANLELGFAVIF